MNSKESSPECHKNQQQQQDYQCQPPLPTYSSNMPTSIHSTVIVPPQSTGKTAISPKQPALIHSYEQRTVHIRETRIIGIIQVVVGALSLIFGFSLVLLGIFDRDSLAGYGLFGIAGILPGSFILANGVIGIFSSGNPNSGCLNGTNLAFSIISCLLSLGNISAFSITIILLQECSESRYNDKWGYRNVCTERTTGSALASVLLLSNFFEFVVALASSLFTCCFYRCCKECLHSSRKGSENKKFFIQ